MFTLVHQQLRQGVVDGDQLCCQVKNGELVAAFVVVVDQKPLADVDTGAFADELGKPCVDGDNIVVFADTQVDWYINFNLSCQHIGKYSLFELLSQLWSIGTGGRNFDLGTFDLKRRRNKTNVVLSINVVSELVETFFPKQLFMGKLDEASSLWTSPVPARVGRDQCSVTRVRRMCDLVQTNPVF